MLFFYYINFIISYQNNSHSYRTIYFHYYQLFLLIEYYLQKL